MQGKLPKEHLVPGAVVTVGPAKLPGGGLDRSWTDAIWRIEGISGDNVLCKRMTSLSGYADLIFMRYPDHDWHAAEHVLDAYLAASLEIERESAAQKLARTAGLPAHMAVDVKA